MVHFSWISPLPFPLPLAGMNSLTPVMLCLAGSHPSGLPSSLLRSVSSLLRSVSSMDAVADAGLFIATYDMSIAIRPEP